MRFFLVETNWAAEDVNIVFVKSGHFLPCQKEFEKVVQRPLIDLIIHKIS